MVYGSLLFIYVLVWMFDGRLWFSDEGILNPSAAESIAGGYRKSVFFFFDAPLFVQICLSLMMLQCILLILGCWSRFQMACIFFWLVSFQHRNLMILDSEDIVFRVFAFLMIFIPLDHRWSLARRITGRQSDATSQQTWALRLIQIQVAVIYLSSAWCKLQGETWHDGTAMFFVSRLDDYFGRFWMPDLFEIAWLVRFLTWGVVLVEIMIPLAVWFRFSWVYAIAVGLLLHLGIEYSMNLFLFQWIMMAGLLSFIRLPAGAEVEQRHVIETESMTLD